MESTWTGPLTPLGLTTLAIAASLIAATHLSPEAMVALHFDLSGHPDRFASGSTASLIWAGVLGGFWLFMTVMRIALAGGGRTTPRTIKAFDIAWLGLTTMLIVLDAMAFAHALGRPTDVASALPFLIGGFTLLLGNLLGTISPNPYIGVRLPWTLRNRDVWDRTHRTGSRIFITAGLCQIALAFGLIGLPPAWRAGMGTIGACAFLGGAGLISAILSWRYAREMGAL